MSPHFLVLLLIPIVHGTVGRFNLFNPFRNILPSVQYYQLGGSDSFIDDRRQDNFHHNSHVPQFTTLLERCLAKNGFYIDGYCYVYVSTPEFFTNAVSGCQGRGGVLWLPEVNDPLLYAKLVDATRPLNPDPFAAPGSRWWVGIRNGNLDLLGNVQTNYLLSLLPNGIPNCGAFLFTSGALLLVNEPNCGATTTHTYFCQIPI